MFTLRELLLLLLLLFVAEKDTDGCPVRKEEMANCNGEARGVYLRRSQLRVEQRYAAVKIGSRLLWCLDSYTTLKGVYTV